MPGMVLLDPKAAFLHVIDAHRWLAASGCAWNLVGANAVNEMKDEAHRLLPNIDVAVLDSLLTHARSLIDFYTKSPPRRDDITLGDFNLSLDQSLSADLEKYKKPIEVHLLHLTNWRDLDFRTLHPTGSAATTARPNWNSEASKIAELTIEKALRKVSEQGTTGWPLAFKALFDASSERYRNKLFAWPIELTEKSDVEQFLTKLGL
jgi:hypothetical protein